MSFMSNTSGTFKLVTTNSHTSTSLSSQTYGSRVESTSNTAREKKCKNDGSVIQTVQQNSSRKVWSFEDGEDNTTVSVGTRLSQQTIVSTSSLHCCMPHRRAGVSTLHLKLIPRSDVETLPYGIRLMRDVISKTDKHATDQLHLVATLRNSLCYLPPVFNVRAKELCSILGKVYTDLFAGWTCSYILLGLVDLASTIPGPASIDFTRIPAERVQVVSHEGGPVDTSQWHAGTQCIAAYCLQIIRALPEHS